MGTLIGSMFRDALALQFNGTNQYAYVDNPTFKSNTQGAFSIWYRPATIFSGDAFEAFVGFGTKQGGHNTTFALALIRNSSPSIGATYRNKTIPEIGARTTNGGNYNRAYGNHIFTAGTLAHLVFQSNGSAWQIYVNGISVGATGWLLAGNTGDWLGDVDPSNVNGHRLTFGSNFALNAALQWNDCKLNEACYFDRPLTSGEITSLYNGGAPGNPHRITTLGSAWKSWWRMGDSRDNATTIYDEIGSDNLTMVNMDASNYVTP